MLIKDFRYKSFMNNWRNKIDPFLRTHLEAQVRDSSRYRRAYKESKDPGKAQLWVAIANLSRQLFNVSVKLKYMERLFQDMNDSKNKQEKKTKKRRK